MFRVILILIICFLIFGAGIQCASADNWQWPAQINVAGFNISAVSGSANADGSGTATGKLDIPGAGAQSVSLNRSSKGEITGNSSVSARISGAQISGNFSLNDRGFAGKGSIDISQRTISDASISISSGGQFSGSGGISLGGVGLNSTFTISGSSSSVSASGPIQAQADMPLAVYQFNGNLNLQMNNGRQVITADGIVQRTGKLASQVSNENVSGIAVNTSDGRGVASVGGVNVTFEFF